MIRARSHSSRVVTLVSVLLATTIARRSFAQQGLLAAGVGSVGNWDTEIELANPFDEPMIVLLSQFPFEDFNTGCDFGCNVRTIGLPPHGSQHLKVDDSIVNPENNPGFDALEAGRLFTLFFARYVGFLDPTAHAQDLPVAHAHAVNRISGAQTEIPVVSLASTLNRASPDTLVFPGVVRSDAVHCNLVLSSIDAEPLDPEHAKVDAPAFAANLKLFDAGGTLLASRDISARDCQFPVEGLKCANAFILDVAQFLGVPSLQAGSLQVSQTTGGRALWGEMPCVSSDGTVAVYWGSQP